MSQHDYNLENATGAAFRSDLNDALEAIASNNAGSTAPAQTFPHMLWFDQNDDLMKIRDEANSAWVVVAKKNANGWTPYRQGAALGTASVQADTRYAHRSNNLSDLANAATARNNLGVIADSTDPDLTQDPNAAARRGLVADAIDEASPVKAWVNFNGTGTVSIRDSFNVSSIADNGTGDYSVNFATPMVSANYAVVGSGGAESTNRPANVGPSGTNSTPYSTTSADLLFSDFNTNLKDVAHASVVVIGG